jgi:hypothetical protein
MSTSRVFIRWSKAIGAGTAAVALAGLPLPAQRVLSGRVADSLSAPVAFAQVSLVGTKTMTVTDRDGRYRIRLAQSGRVTVLVRRLGYRPEQHDIDVSGDSTIDASFTLLPAPMTLEAVTTVAERTRSLDRAGFYERMLDASKGLLTGSFVGPEEIEARHPSSILHMLEGHNGVSLMRKKIMGNGGSCEMMVYVNGHLVDGFDARTGTSRIARDRALMRRADSVAPSTSPVEEAAAPTEVAGIEIYPRAVNAPAAFQRLAGSCGIVLIWTK